MNQVIKTLVLFPLCFLVVCVPSVWANWVTDGVLLCTERPNQQRPTIVSDGAGGAIVAWEDWRTEGYPHIYAQRINGSGDVQWAADGVALCTAAWYQEFPAIVSDSAGGAIVTWMDVRSSSGIYAQRLNGSGAVQWTTDGVALCMAAGDQQNPAIVSDGAGGAIVTWMDTRSGSSDIYAQRVNASGVVQWTADGIAICTATGLQQNATMVSDGAGGAIVTWQDWRSGISHVYAQRVNALGTVQWTANGFDLSTTTGGKWYPKITSDGVGGAIVIWQDERSGNYDIYAQRMNASGIVQWTTNGTALCTAIGSQVCPAIVSDGAGGAIVTWYDWRGGSNIDIYAQAVNAPGIVQWTADGVAICTAAGNQLYPTIDSDGTGGAIVTWYDLRSGNNYDIYAQRVNVSGAVQWTTDGAALCAAAGDQDYPQIASDGAGGAIVTWNDHRAGPIYTQIYGMRVDANGFPVLTPSEAPAIPLALHQNYPNPFNPTTTVTYSVPERCTVTLGIYDASGRRVASLVGGMEEKGTHAVEWNGRDDAGNSLASGVYFCRLAVGSHMLSRKMVLLR